MKFVCDLLGLRSIGRDPRRRARDHEVDPAVPLGDERGEPVDGGSASDVDALRPDVQSRIPEPARGHGDAVGIAAGQVDVAIRAEPLRDAGD